MQKITPFLWFNGNVEEAINCYSALFKDAEIINMYRPDGNGKVFTGTFDLMGHRFYALDGGPLFSFTPANSFFVELSNENDLDALWSGLNNGGTALMPLGKYPFSEKFGWVKDKFGISWQLSLSNDTRKIYPFLMFVNQQHGRAEEAIQFYVSTFTNSSVTKLEHYNKGEFGIEGTLKLGSCNLDGVDFMAIDSNFTHEFNFSPAVSYFVSCNTQEETDYYWNRLLEGGKEERCGWLTDKFGVSWQIIPLKLGELLYGKDPIKSKRVMDAMLKMKKIIIADLVDAYEKE